MKRRAAKPDPTALPEKWPETVVGGKYVRMLERFVRGLRPADAHGNRSLFLDDVFVCYLLAFFNPTLRSLRTLDDFSRSRQAQAHLSVRRLPRSTLSDFNRVAEPDLLLPLIAQLRGRVPAAALPSDLSAVLGQVLAVDGSFFAVAADVAWAVRHRCNNGSKRATVRLDCHLDVATGLPEIVDVCGAGTSEPAGSKLHIRPGAIHVYDRGFLDFALLAAHAGAGASFVIRMRAPGERSPKFDAAADRPLSPEAAAAGVLSDRTGRLAGSGHRPAPDTVLREVVVANPDQPGGCVRLLTDIPDLDASVIAHIYRYRWQVELFFRWLKVFAGFRHLISESRNGIRLGFHVAVIGALLMHLHTGARPNKYVFAMLSVVAAGGSDLADVAPILTERLRQIAVANARVARKRAEAKAAAAAKKS